MYQPFHKVCTGSKDCTERSRSFVCSSSKVLLAVDIWAQNKWSLQEASFGHDLFSHSLPLCLHSRLLQASLLFLKTKPGLLLTKLKTPQNRESCLFWSISTKIIKIISPSDILQSVFLPSCYLFIGQKKARIKED